MKFFRTCAVLFVCLALVAPVLAFVSQNDPAKASRVIEPRKVTARTERIDRDESSTLGLAARTFVDRNGGQWDFRVDRRTGRAGIVLGSGLPMIPGRGNSLGPDSLAGLGIVDGRVTVEALEPRIREFIATHAELIGAPEGNLVLDRKASQLREDGRLISYYFNWEVDGVPVEEASVFVRINSGNVTQFGSRWIGPMDTVTTPSLSAADAFGRLMTYTGDRDAAEVQGISELVLQPEDGEDGGIEYRLVWKTRYTIPGRIETWEGRVDARTGAIVGFRDVNHYAAQVVGGVYPRTVFDNNETAAPMPLVDVVVGGSTLTSDTAGKYSFAGENVSSGLNGEFFNTSCSGCSNPSQPSVDQIGLGNGRLDFGFGGQDNTGNGMSTPADRNSFYHLNQIRRIALKWLPALPWLQTTITSNVNINNSCNAVYNGAVNFYRAGGDCNNTGEVSDVMHHEWGHGIDGNTNGGDGGTGEGTADVAAMQMSHSPLVGPGFRTNGNPVRNLDSSVSSLGVMTNSRIQNGDCNILPGGGLSVHCVGQVYGQSAWDLSQALVAKYGHHTGWRVSERLYFTSLPDADTYDPASSQSIYLAYLFADDDDGNLNNGTPNATEIFNAFDTHEIAQQERPSSPVCSRPSQPVLTVTPGCSGFDLSWTDVPEGSHYEIYRAELREDTAYFFVDQVPLQQTTYTDTEVVPGVDYYYVVMAVDSTDCESTVESPRFGRLTAQASLSLTAAVADDTPRGNRSGFADPAEEVDVVLTMRNVGEIDAANVSGTIVALTPGVTILDGTSAWNALTVGGSGASLDALRFEADDQLVSCGDVVSFELIPTDDSGCASDSSFFEIQIGESDGQGGFLCDSTPACFIEPTFSGLNAAASGASCAEVALDWSAAVSNCVNAEITYNVYRGTDPGFAPGPGNLVAQGVTETALTDPLLDPGQAYHYVVRAFDSRSGEESNSVVKSAVAPAGPDLGAPVFSGLDVAVSGAGCGETVLSWPAALETCSAPVVYDVFRSTDPLFVPGPAELIGQTFSTALADAALTPGVSYTYVVRARDAVGNTDGNELRVATDAALLDLTVFETRFEPDNAGWSVSAPNDATAGNWQWGDPVQTSWQSDDDATPGGVNAWITGLSSTPSNGDIDGGTTTLLSTAFDLAGAVSPVVRYSRWFTNDRGNSPGDATDTFRIEVSNDDGTNWHELEVVGAGTPLAWVPVEIGLPASAPPSATMRFRFQAADLGNGSLVEAGIDDFSVVDQGQGCSVCAGTPDTVGRITVRRVGDDIEVDWTSDPAAGSRFIVYAITQPVIGEDIGLRLGSTDGRSFLHEGAALSGESFLYRVSTVDACGVESSKE